MPHLTTLSTLVTISQDRVTTGSRSLQPLRLRNRCGEALAITICNRRGGAEAVRLTLGNEKGKLRTLFSEFALGCVEEVSHACIPKKTLPTMLSTAFLVR